MSDTSALNQDALKLFRRPWGFVKGVVALDGLPVADRREIAFAGRSNVGKSSLINALTGQKSLARTSSTPGRTQEINFFRPEAEDAACYLVDLPGYGYAKAPKGQVISWTDLVKDYLRGRPTLNRIFLLVDARHGLKDNDIDIMKMLDEAAVSYQVVLTKIDKLKPPAREKIVIEVTEGLRKRPAAYPVVLATSSEKNWGIEILAEAAGKVLLNMESIADE